MDGYEFVRKENLIGIVSHPHSGSSSINVGNFPLSHMESVN